MNIEELKAKAAALPLSPGVYIMQDKENTVIYVGKAKKLKNRVSQYFQDTQSHSSKTKLMVSKIDHFDVIVTASELEALVLECSLIKRHMPKYNILLKDDKGYPYLHLDMKESYPVIRLVNRVTRDAGNCYGPYGSRGITQELLKTITAALKLPDCKKQFPRDIGKCRPCLNYHMNLCDGWCQEEKSKEEYRSRIEQGRQLLLGNHRQVSSQIRQQMLEASDSLNFELAASLRDRLKSVEALSQKQLVTAGVQADTDVIGLCQNESKTCFTVLHFSCGSLLDKEYEILNITDEPYAVLSAMLSQYYLDKGYAPKQILLPIAFEDSALFEQLLEEKLGHHTKLHTPQRGDLAGLVRMANTNAAEELERITTKEERHRNTLTRLGRMLNIPVPLRIESFDISNISGTDTVASMVVFLEGKPSKKDYKKFTLRDMDGQDDYAAMEQVVARRCVHLLNGDEGFADRPDLMLIDGGISHAVTALNVLHQLKLDIPVFGMVKDDRHRTRALVTPGGQEIRIDSQQAIFALIGTIQEETHRFAITYHRQKRSSRLKYSELDNIPGIGPKRKQDLLKHFHSIAAIRQASVAELQRIVPADAANSIYRYFNQTKE